jgi:hypothetical protein
LAGRDVEKGAAVERQPVVAIAFLTEANLRAIGRNLERIYPINDNPAFADLLAAIEMAERRVERPQ